jgi:DNA-binding NtrC family response regulator
MTVAAPLAAAGRVLVVDDDRRMASGIAQGLCAAGLHASAAGSAAEALRALARGGWDACVLDGALAAGGSAQVAAALRAGSPRAGLVVVAPSRATASSLAADATLAPPLADGAVLEAVESARRRVAARIETARPHGLLGSHPAMRRVLDLVARVAATPATVLVTGESGTGKSLVAHCHSHTDEQPVWRIPLERFERELAVFRRDQDAFDRGLAPR